MKRLILLIMAALALSHCAPEPDELKCTANFEGSGMSVRMEYLRDNSDGSAAYLIKLCEDSTPNPIVFSVYGAAVTDTGVTNPSTQVRLQSVSESSHSGAQFEVNFKSFDTKFFIYRDRTIPGTGYTLDTSVELVSGDLSQAHYAGGG